ncbi:MAG: hypothetical protein ABI304_11545 [Rudaea sp.]
MPNESKKSKLTLINCSRIALEEEIRRVIWTGTNEELHAVVGRMMPCGKLRLVSKNSAPTQVGNDDVQEHQQ